MPDKEISFENLKKLLLLLCRYPFEEADKETLAFLISEVSDWSRMVALINAHGIIALAAYNIREAGLEKLLPADAMAALDNGRMQSMVRNTWLSENWKEVNTILTEAGIKHVLLKGMALEHTLYGAKGLRQMTDNDILIKREDSLKAWCLLQEKGFTRGLIKSAKFNRIIINIGEHLPPLYKNGYAIEIHHRIYDPGHANGKYFYNPIDETEETFIGDTKAWVLNKKAQLEHLINHFERHSLGGDQQLRLYADIVLLDKTAKIEIFDDFILNPQQNSKVKYIKASYKAGLNSIPVKYRFRFIIGDIFPSVTWMKNRYECNTLKAILHYPPRIGKLLWLMEGKAGRR
jgi:hypothetical protein